MSVLVAGALVLMTDSVPTRQPEIVYDFQWGPAHPSAGLVEGTSGTFFGTTIRGGSGDGGTVFQMTTNGVFTSLVSGHGIEHQNPVVLLAP